MGLRLALWAVVTCTAILPCGALLFTAFTQRDAAWRMLFDGATHAALWHSFVTSALAMVIATALGAIFAFAVVVGNVRGKAWLSFAFILPMMIPPQVSALAWLQLTGPAGVLGNALGIAPPLGSPQPLYSAFGIALLLGIQSAPLVFLALRGQLIHLPQELLEAGAISGAGRGALWRDTVFPLSRSGLVSGASLAFVSSLGNFGIPAMLGIPIGYYTLPTLIYQKMSGFGTSVLPEIATLALCIGTLTLVGILVRQKLLKRYEYALIGHTKNRPLIALGRARVAVEMALWSVLLLILFVPLLALVLASFVPAIGVPLAWENLSFAAYQEMLFRQQATLRAVGNSLLLSIGAALLLMLLSLPAAYILQRLRQSERVVLLSLIDLPYALPGVVLAIACIILFVKPLPVIDVHLYATLGIIFIAYVMRFFAVALNPVYSATTQLSPAMEQAAQLAGAGVWLRLKDIFLPLLAPSLAAGALLVFLTAVNELTVSALLWSSGNETLGMMVYSLEESGYSVAASALSVLIILMIIAVMLLLSLFARHLPPGVIPWFDAESVPRGRRA